MDQDQANKLIASAQSSIVESKEALELSKQKLTKVKGVVSTALDKNKKVQKEIDGHIEKIVSDLDENTVEYLKNIE